MKIMTKKVLREFRFNKFRSISIVVTVALSVAFLVGLNAALQSMNASLEKNHEIFNNAEVRIRYPTFLNSSSVTELPDLEDMQRAGVIAVEGRIFLYSEVEYKDKTYTAYWIAINSTEDKQNEINKLIAKKGDNFISSNENVLVEAHFGLGLLGPGVDLEDELTIKYGGIVEESLEISGVVSDSDYYYVANELTSMPEFGNLCVFYTSLKKAQDLLGINNSVNEILVKTEERTTNAADRASQAITRHFGDDANTKVIRYDETADKEMFNADAGPMDKMGFVFGFFGLVCAAIVIYNSLSKMVISQRTYIGLFGALGSKKRDLIFHYIYFGLILGIIGVIIGLILSLGVAYGMGLLVTYIYFWETLEIVVDPLTYLLGSVITLSVVAFFSAISALPSLRLTPREAMQPPYSIAQRGSEPIVEKILRNIPGFRSLVSRIPLRTVFMKGNRRRTISTVSAIAISMIILVGSWGMFYNMMDQLNRNYNIYQKFDVNFITTNIISESDAIEWIENNIDGIDIVEGYIYTEVWVSTDEIEADDDEALRFELQAFHQDTVLREYGIGAGEGQFSSNECLIGKIAANELDINVGDTINISSTGWKEVEVTGIVQELMDNSIIWTVEAIQSNENLLGFADDYVNGIAFTFKENADPEEIKEEILVQFQTDTYTVAVYNSNKEAYESLERLLETLMGLLFAFIAFGILLLSLFTFSAMSLAMMDRELEFLALRAQGIQRRKILWIITLENLIYGLFGFIVGIPICLGSLRWAFDYIMPDFYIPVNLPLEIWSVVAGIIFFSVFLSSVLIAWKVLRTSMPDFLRNRMIS